MRVVPYWDAYFMDIARTISSRSKDPETQVGAVLVDSDNHIIGTGYNGFIPGMPETSDLWVRPIKYDYVVHAEANCILHAIKKPKDCKLYTTLYPCKECAKLIAAAGIKEIIYFDDKYMNGISSDIFHYAKIKVWKCDI